jgi:bifunctional non-homologous end joining protein LigD
MGTTSASKRSQQALIGSDDHSLIQYSEEFHGDGAAFFKACADRKLEGIVSKLATSRYQSGRTKTWLKTKCFTESTFVVIGTERDRKTEALRALLAHADSAGLNPQRAMTTSRSPSRGSMRIIGIWSL